MYSEANGLVVITMTVEDWLSVLWLLGIAGGSLDRVDSKLFRESIALVNRLNEGNPNFVQVDLSEEK